MGWFDDSINWVERKAKSFENDSVANIKQVAHHPIDSVMAYPHKQLMLDVGIAKSITGIFGLIGDGGHILGDGMLSTLSFGKLGTGWHLHSDCQDWFDKKVDQGAATIGIVAKNENDKSWQKGGKLAGTVAQFFIGTGEVKAAATGLKGAELLNDASKGAKIFTAASKTAEGAEIASKSGNVISNLWHSTSSFFHDFSFFKSAKAAETATKAEKTAKVADEVAKAAKVEHTAEAGSQGAKLGKAYKTENFADKTGDVSKTAEEAKVGGKAAGDFAKAAKSIKLGERSSYRLYRSSTLSTAQKIEALEARGTEKSQKYVTKLLEKLEFKKPTAATAAEVNEIRGSKLITPATKAEFEKAYATQLKSSFLGRAASRAGFVVKNPVLTLVENAFLPQKILLSGAKDMATGNILQKGWGAAKFAGGAYVTGTEVYAPFNNVGTDFIGHTIGKKWQNELSDSLHSHDKTFLIGPLTNAAGNFVKAPEKDDATSKKSAGNSNAQPDSNVANKDDPDSGGLSEFFNSIAGEVKEYPGIAAMIGAVGAFITGNMTGHEGLGAMAALAIAAAGFYFSHGSEESTPKQPVPVVANKQTNKFSSLVPG